MELITGTYKNGTYNTEPTIWSGEKALYNA